MCSAGLYLNMFYMHQYSVCICSVRNRKFLHPFVPTCGNIVKYFLFTIHLYLMHVLAWLMSLMTSEHHLYIILEVLYKFRKIPTGISSLVDIKTCLHYWYTFLVQPCHYDVKLSYCWTCFAFSRYWKSGDYIVWTFIT